MSRLIRKSLNVLLASSKISVDGRGISTEGFGRGCGESAIKVALGVAQALISITLASTEILERQALGVLITVESFDGGDETASITHELARQVCLGKLHLGHGAVVSLPDEIAAMHPVSAGCERNCKSHACEAVEEQAQPTGGDHASAWIPTRAPASVIVITRLKVEEGLLVET